jgi:hypothetical protein
MSSQESLVSTSKRNSFEIENFPFPLQFIATYNPYQVEIKSKCAIFLKNMRMSISCGCLASFELEWGQQKASFRPKQLEHKNMSGTEGVL